MKIKFIDLFCGCGGLSTGLEKAGMECILGVDSDNDAINTFQRNHKSAKAYLGIIETLATSKIKEIIGSSSIDLIAGGPRCRSALTKSDPI
jgi:DNA (cytosine-5)-methyltransferase 1